MEVELVDAPLPRGAGEQAGSGEGGGEVSPSAVLCAPPVDSSAVAVAPPNGLAAHVAAIAGPDEEPGAVVGIGVGVEVVVEAAAAEVSAVGAAVVVVIEVKHGDSRGRVDEPAAAKRAADLSGAGEESSLAGRSGEVVIGPRSSRVSSTRQARQMGSREGRRHHSQTLVGPGSKAPWSLISPHPAHRG